MPSPAPLLTQSLLHSIRTQPHLPPHAWYLVTGVTLSILNRPDELPKVLSHALSFGPGSAIGDNSHDTPNKAVHGSATGSMETKDSDIALRRALPGPSREEQLLIARKLREALIKSAAIGGLPKVCILVFF